MINLENRIDKIFKNLKSSNKRAFISFTTAGFPEDDTSLEIIKSIADSGAHIHEISFPHAEAQADGPIIQLANIESIKNGINFNKVINIAKEARKYNQEIGLVMMGYLNNIFIYGIEKFAKDGKNIEDKRTMALVNKPNYSLLQNSLKIDDLIDPRMNTVSSILKHIHKGTIETAYTILNGEYEVIEAEIIETSELINKELKNSNLPEAVSYTHLTLPTNREV